VDILMTVLGFLVLLMIAVAIAILLGYLTSADHTCRAEASINQPPEDVFDLLRAIERQAEWRKLVASVNVETPDKAVRLSFKANPMDARISVPEAHRPDRLVLAGEEVGGATSWTWTIEIAPEGERGSRVAIEETGQNRHPWYRFVARYVTGYDKQIRDLLRDLSHAYPNG